MWPLFVESFTCQDGVAIGVFLTPTSRVMKLTRKLRNGSLHVQIVRNNKGIIEIHYHRYPLEKMAHKRSLTDKTTFQITHLSKVWKLRNCLYVRNIYSFSSKTFTISAYLIFATDTILNHFFYSGLQDCLLFVIIFYTNVYPAQGSRTRF